MILVPKLELRTEQPSGYVPPVGQLFGRRVRAVYNPAADRVFGSGTITHVGGSVVPTEEKLAFRTTTASQGLYSKLSEIYDPTTGSVTLVCLFRNIEPGPTTTGLGSSSGGSGTTLCMIGVTSTNFIQLDFKDSVGNGLVSVGWPAGVSNSKFHTLVLTLASTGYAVYFDSTLIGSGALSGAPASTVFDYLQISCLVRGGAVLSGLGSAQDVAFAAVLDGAVSDTEARAISSNLWQTFQPQTRRAFVGVSGGGGTDLYGAASGTSQASGTATLSAQVALAGVGVALAGGSATASATVPISATGISVSGGDAALTATIAIAAAGLAQAAGAAGLSASILLSGSGAALAAGNATLAAQLAALASGSAQASGSATLSGGAPGAISAFGTSVAGGSGTLEVTVQLAATGTAQASGTATLSGGPEGEIAASGGAVAGGSGTLAVTVAITAAGFVQAMGAGAMLVSVQLAATGSATAGGSAVLRLLGAAVPVLDLRYVARAVRRDYTARYGLTSR